MPNRLQAITQTSADPVHWCVYVALGGDELNISIVVGDVLVIEHQAISIHNVDSLFAVSKQFNENDYF